MNNFLTIVTNAQIASALVLIAFFLAYIALRISNQKKGKHSKS